MREKANAKMKAKKMADEEFTKATGIINEAAETPTLEAMIRKNKFDQARLDKKNAKIKKMENEGVDFYEEDDISVSEDDFDDEE